MLFHCVFQVCSCVVLISKDKSNNNIINQLFFLKLIHLNVSVILTALVNTLLNYKNLLCN